MNAEALPAPRLGWTGLFLELTKFRISAVSTFSAATGYLAFRHRVDWGLASALAGTLLLALAASAMNEVQERRVDALMTRTRFRPIPSGAVAAGTAAALALSLATAGFLVLLLVHGWPAALLGAAAMAWYNLLYTPLKRVSAFAVVPGSVIGALPPAIGWAAAGGAPGDPALLALCFFFFLWQVPHFWLLALLHRHDYERAGLPVLHRYFTVPQIERLVFTWTCGTVASCALLPAFRATSGAVVLAVLAAASVWLLVRFRVLLQPEPSARRIRVAFMDINAYLVVVMIGIVLDALGMP